VHTSRAGGSKARTQASRMAASQQRSLLGLRSGECPSSPSQPLAQVTHHAAAKATVTPSSCARSMVGAGADHSIAWDKRIISHLRRMRG
jgi:hypothetical protein